MHKIANDCTFSAFISNICQGNCTFDMQPQINFLFDKNGELDIDYIFRFEQPGEIRKFFTRRGYDFKDIEITSRPKNLKNYYTPQLAKIITSMCWFETKYFGYTAPLLTDT